jgi:hypothetical protein
MLLRWFLGFSVVLTSRGPHDVAQNKNDIVFDDDDNESGGAAASVHDDVVASSEVESTVNGYGGEYADETIPEKPATESSEMQTRVQVQPGNIQMVEKWPLQGAMHGAMHVMSVPDSPEMPRKVTSLTATSKRVTENPPNLGPLPTQVQLQRQVTEEYDDADVEGDTVGTPAADEKVGLDDGEPMTYEDRHRKKHGDVDKIARPVRKEKRADPPEYHPPPPATQAQQQIRVIPGGPYVPGSFIGQKKHLRATAYTKRNAEQRMMKQCTAYTNFLVKSQGLIPPMGPKILQMMKATCDGAVKEGVPNSQYTLMCNALGSAVEPFLVAPTTDWGGICSEVLRVFKEAGIGQF